MFEQVGLTPECVWYLDQHFSRFSGADLQVVIDMSCTGQTRGEFGASHHVIQVLGLEPPSKILCLISPRSLGK